MKLPELPTPSMYFVLSEDHIYNETQLIEYGLACAEAMREACAVASEESPYPDGGDIASEVIRALEIET